jgi:hypothetical protein
VDLGMADRHCTASHDYQTQQPQHITNHAQPQVKSTPRLGQRKFAV